MGVGEGERTSHVKVCGFCRFLVVGRENLGVIDGDVEGRVVFVATGGGGLEVGDGFEEVEDLSVLVDRFSEGEERLVVCGGKEVFEFFEPHASEVRLVETEADVAGDVEFNAWEKSGFFALVGEEKWDGGKDLLLERRKGSAVHALGAYMDGILKGNPEKACELHMGHRYTQHSTGVGDGKEGFCAFFATFLAAHPQRDFDVVHVIEDGRFAFCHCRQKLDGEGGPIWITADMFETSPAEGGRILEHWDVIEAGREDAMDVSGPRYATDLHKTEENRKLVRAFLTHVVQNREIDRISDYVHPDVIHHTKEGDGGAGGGGEGAGNGLEEYVRALSNPDDAYEFVFKVLAQGSLVAAYSKVTHAGGEPPEPGEIAFDARMELFRVHEGKIAERWVVKEFASPREVWKNVGKF